MLKRILLLILVLGLPWIVGCGDPAVSYAPVTGRVTLDGQPVANAKILFVPVRYRNTQQEVLPFAYGTTDEDGHYTLRSDGNHRGAVAGQHLIFVSTKYVPTDEKDGKANPESSSAQKSEPRDETIPARYNVESKLTRTVKRGTANQFNLQLKSE